jgi:hypothetical protein
VGGNNGAGSGGYVLLFAAICVLFSMLFARIDLASSATDRWRVSASRHEATRVGQAKQVVREQVPRVQASHAMGNYVNLTMRKAFCDLFGKRLCALLYPPYDRNIGKAGIRMPAREIPEVILTNDLLRKEKSAGKNEIHPCPLLGSGSVERKCAHQIS